MRYLIHHETILDYAEPVREHHTELRLAPRIDPRQHLVSCTLETEPAAPLVGYSDYFGNRVDYFCVIPAHTRLVTRLKAEVEVTRHNPFDFEPVAPHLQQQWLHDAVKREPRYNDFVLHRSLLTPPVMKLADHTARAFPRFERDQPVMQSLQELMGWIPAVLKYRSGSTGVHAELINALQQGAGVCQEFAHLFISIARSWGIPSRYVMGYLAQSSADDAAENSTHAWAEALVPGGGWIGFDPVHNLLANERYIAVAVGRDSYDAAPQRGSFKGDSAGSEPLVTVQVQQVQQQ